MEVKIEQAMEPICCCRHWRQDDPDYPTAGTEQGVCYKITPPYHTNPPSDHAEVVALGWLEDRNVFVTHRYWGCYEWEPKEE